MSRDRVLAALFPPRSRVRRKRSAPRRGRVIDKLFLAFIAKTKGCLLAGKHACHSWLTIHHVKEFPGAPKNDLRVVRLCAAAHLHGFSKDAIEHGRANWEKRWGVDLEAVMRKQRAEYAALYPERGVAA